ncbi:hypothetical protein B0H13DRAFT_2325746 [Mycena leptocephala]|nr:hypothetical protein B0H13DRAFT_2325746 [Mycena leptocephala]
MSPHPALAILKKGLSNLKDSIKLRKDALEKKLKKAERISDADSAWLDDAANHVEEDAVLLKLENASDYERGLARLDTKIYPGTPSHPSSFHAPQISRRRRWIICTQS